MKKAGDKPAAPRRKPSREDLAERLRANLRRRKAQARQRHKGQGGDDPKG